MTSLARRCGVVLTPAHRALVGRGNLARTPVIFALPQTFMNDSGVAVAALVRAYGIAPADQLIVVHDELDLGPGVVRLKYGGGSAGHNGLRSVGAHLKSLEFWRVRVGIGRPLERRDVVAWVLDEPRGVDREAFGRGIETAASAIEELLDRGAQRAMTAVNARGLERGA